MSAPEEPADLNEQEGDIDPPEQNEPTSASLTLGEVEQNIEQLMEKVKALQAVAVKASDNGDPETLSKTLLQLARINSALGKNGAYAQYIARNTDRAARRTRAQSTLDYAKGQAVNKSELQAELDSKEDFQLASDAQLIADQASDLCFRTDTFLKMAQSRLSLIKGDIRNG